jgi:hypothetical protein
MNRVKGFPGIFKHRSLKDLTVVYHEPRPGLSWNFQAEKSERLNSALP